MYEKIITVPTIPIITPIENETMISTKFSPPYRSFSMYPQWGHFFFSACLSFPHLGHLIHKLMLRVSPCYYCSFAFWTNPIFPDDLESVNMWRFFGDH